MVFQFFGNGVDEEDQPIVAVHFLSFDQPTDPKGGRLGFLSSPATASRRWLIKKQ
jgi:hypothetical protein